MLHVLPGEALQGRLGFGGPQAQRGRVFDHLVELLADRLPTDRSGQNQLEILIYLPENLVLEHIAAGRLVRVLEDWCEPFTGYHLYYASRRQSSRALAVVIEALRHQR